MRGKQSNQNNLSGWRWIFDLEPKQQHASTWDDGVRAHAGCSRDSMRTSCGAAIGARSVGTLVAAAIEFASCASTRGRAAACAEEWPGIFSRSPLSCVLAASEDEPPELASEITEID